MAARRGGSKCTERKINKGIVLFNKASVNSGVSVVNILSR